MANSDNSFGFKYIQSRDGRDSPIKRYYIPSTDSTAVYVGSPVKLAGSADGEGIPTVALCATTAKACGVCIGVDQIADVTDANFSLYRTYRPASVGMYVFVVDDPEALFEIQSDGVGGALAATDIGLNVSYTAESGDTVTGMSTIEIDTSTKATTSTLALKIERLIQRPNNEKFVANQKVLVSFNIHAFKSGYDTGASQEIGGLGV